MHIWGLDVLGTFALSIVASYGFLLLRFRRVGSPFGSRARWWAVAIILVTAVIATGFGLAVAAASQEIRTVYAGLIVPIGLWLVRPLPLRRLSEQIAEDMQAWCDARLECAAPSPLGLTNAVDYYYGQVAERLTDERSRMRLDLWRESIAGKIAIARLIRLNADPVDVRAAIKVRSLPDRPAYYYDDVYGIPERLADRLEHDAQTELGLFLAYLYRCGYREVTVLPARARPRRRAGWLAGGGPFLRQSATAAAGLLVPSATIGVSLGVAAVGVSGVTGGLAPLAATPVAVGLLAAQVLQRRRRPAGQSAAEPAAPPGGSADDQVINFWIPGRQEAETRPLTVGTEYTGIFRVGAPVAGNLAEGQRAIALSDIPEAGLETEWVVWSTTVQIDRVEDQDPGLVEVMTADQGNQVQWMAIFSLVIPRRGDSAERRLLIVPQRAGTARIYAKVRLGRDVYRSVSIQLTTQAQPSFAEPVPVPSPEGPGAVEVAEVRQLPVRHTGLVPCSRWQIPPYCLDVMLLPPHAIVKSSAGAARMLNWDPPADASQLIDAVREALDAFRAEHSDYLDAIEPDDLALRLSRVKPPADWHAPAPAEHGHLQSWQQVATSDKLRRLAFQGNLLYDVMFPADSELRRLIDGLAPGDRLDITWFGRSLPWISHVPWALMYRQRIGGAGSPIDPAEFLGMRLRIAYNSHEMKDSTTRALGDLRQTTRGHMLYWGGDDSDPTAIEAARHKQELAGWSPLVLPSGTDLRKTEVSGFLSTPAPSPVSVLYLYCRCNSGTGTNPVLQFGSTTTADDLIELFEIGRDELDDQPLAFLNGCDTAKAAPFYSNMLENLFFDRGCRAFIGTEAKVPVGLAARFAATFFFFLYRDDGCPVAAGEAFAQARKFLWDQYRNLGGLLYSYVNDYDLFAASDERVAALRQVS